MKHHHIVKTSYSHEEKHFSSISLEFVAYLEEFHLIIRKAFVMRNLNFICKLKDPYFNHLY